MLKQAVFLMFVTLYVCSCGAKKQEMVHFNDELTTINDSLFYKGKIWGEEFKIGFNTGDYSRLPQARLSMTSYIEKSIEEVSNMKDVGDSRAFREAELSYLRFEKDTIMPYMEAFESFTDSTSHEAITAAYNALLSSAQKESAKLEQVRRVQKEYADKNNIELKPSAMSLIQ